MVKDTAAERFIAPALKDYQRAQNQARFVTPGGRLLEVDHALAQRAALAAGIAAEVEVRDPPNVARFFADLS